MTGSTVGFDSSLTVLYGKNGSGKSSSTGALLASLAGRIDQPHAPVDIGVTHVLVEIPDGSAFMGSLIGDRATRPVFAHRLYNQIRGLWPQCPDDSIAEELAADVVAALFPVGIGRPAWDVWLCVGRGHSKAGTLWQQCATRWRTNRELLEHFTKIGGDIEAARQGRGEIAEITGVPVAAVDTESLLGASLGEGDHFQRAYLAAFAGLVDLDNAASAQVLWSFGVNDQLPLPLLRLGRTDRLDLPLVDEVSTDSFALTRA